MSRGIGYGDYNITSTYQGSQAINIVEVVDIVDAGHLQAKFVIEAISVDGSVAILQVNGLKVVQRDDGA